MGFLRVEKPHFLIAALKPTHQLLGLNLRLQNMANFSFIAMIRVPLPAQFFPIKLIAGLSAQILDEGKLITEHSKQIIRSISVALCQAEFPPPISILQAGAEFSYNSAKEYSVLRGVFVRVAHIQQFMSKFLSLGKYSFGMGDRFGHQGKAQLQACVLATELGAHFVPVWNKSNREHSFIGTEPSSLRAEADAAVKALNWKTSYHVDADHIRLETVDRFITPSDFFTIDVADSIGKPASATDVKAFVERHPELTGKISIPHIEHPFEITRAEVERVANKFLLAVCPG